MAEIRMMGPTDDVGPGKNAKRTGLSLSQRVFHALDATIRMPYSQR